MGHRGVSPCCINPPITKVVHRNDPNAPSNTTESYPHPQASPIIWGNHCGSDDRDCHTHNLAGQLCPRGSQHHWHLTVHQGSTSRRCGHARHRPTPTPRGDGQATHTHTQSTQSRCVPFSDPHVHKVTRSNDTDRNEPTATQHIGASPAYGEDTPDRRQVQRKEKEGVHEQRVRCQD